MVVVAATFARDAGRAQDGAAEQTRLRYDLLHELMQGSLGARLAAKEDVVFPLAVPKELASSLRISVKGRGRAIGFELRDSQGQRLTLEPTADGAGGFTLEDVLDGARIERALGRAPVGRLELRVVSGADGEWPTLRAEVELPAVGEEELRATIVEHLDAIFATWLEHGLDREGPRNTSLACYVFDVVSGERAATMHAGLLPLWGSMFHAAHWTPDARWNAPIERFLADFFELNLDPRTGLPREWDCVLDEPRGDAPVEVASWLRMLLDLSEFGPPAWRERALGAARKMGDSILASGVMPDGSMAATYLSASGAAAGAAVELRSLNVPAQLARLGALTGREDYFTPARRAIAEFEFTLHWGGSAERIDPDFDDNMGTLGAALTTVVEAYPEDPLARRILRDAWNHFLPLWMAALREGGSIAADQVRCWEMAARFARVAGPGDPHPERLIELAARTHLIGELFETGSWGDLTHLGWRPQSGLSVGDLSGMPANLLWGLGLLCDPDLIRGESSADRAQRTALARSWFALVLRSIDEAYRRPYGYLLTSKQVSGVNRCGGELRLCQGLITALRAISPR